MLEILNTIIADGTLSISAGVLSLIASLVALFVELWHRYTENDIEKRIEVKFSDSRITLKSKDIKEIDEQIKKLIEEREKLESLLNKNGEMPSNISESESAEFSSQCESSTIPHELNKRSPKDHNPST